MKKQKKTKKDRNKIAKELFVTKLNQNKVLEIQKIIHAQNLAIREQFAKFVQLIDMFASETEVTINKVMDESDCCPLCKGEKDHIESCPAAMCQEVDKHINSLYKMLNVEFQKKEPEEINETAISQQ